MNKLIKRTLFTILLFLNIAIIKAETITKEEYKNYFESQSTTSITYPENYMYYINNPSAKNTLVQELLNEYNTNINTLMTSNDKELSTEETYNITFTFTNLEETSAKLTLTCNEELLSERNLVIDYADTNSKTSTNQEYVNNIPSTINEEIDLTEENQELINDATAFINKYNYSGTLLSYLENTPITTNIIITNNTLDNPTQRTIDKKVYLLVDGVYYKTVNLHQVYTIKEQVVDNTEEPVIEEPTTINVLDVIKDEYTSTEIEKNAYDNQDKVTEEVYNQIVQDLKDNNIDPKTVLFSIYQEAYAIETKDYIHNWIFENFTDNTTKEFKVKYANTDDYDSANEKIINNINDPLEVTNTLNTITSTEVTTSDETIIASVNTTINNSNIENKFYKTSSEENTYLLSGTLEGESDLFINDVFYKTADVKYNYITNFTLPYTVVNDISYIEGIIQKYLINMNISYLNKPVITKEGNNVYVRDTEEYLGMFTYTKEKAPVTPAPAPASAPTPKPTTNPSKPTTKPSTNKPSNNTTKPSTNNNNKPSTNNNNKPSTNNNNNANNNGTGNTSDPSKDINKTPTKEETKDDNKENEEPVGKPDEGLDGTNEEPTDEQPIEEPTVEEPEENKEEEKDSEEDEEESKDTEDTTMNIIIYSLIGVAGAGLIGSLGYLFYKNSRS